MSTTERAGGPAVTVPPAATAWRTRLMARHAKLLARKIRELDQADEPTGDAA